MMRRHELDPVSLTFGFAFTGLGLLFLVGRADQAFRLRWIWPILLLVLGVGILADLARQRGPEDDAAAVNPPPEPEPEPSLEPELEPEGDRALEREGAVDGREPPADGGPRP
jgi:hypothetical protein